MFWSVKWNYRWNYTLSPPATLARLPSLGGCDTETVAGVVLGISEEKKVLRPTADQPARQPFILRFMASSSLRNHHSELSRPY